MRWPIPIAVVFALLVAVSCDQQPIEPVDDSPTAETLSFSKNPAIVNYEPGSGTFDFCGTEVTWENWCLFPFRYDAGEGEVLSHWLDNTTCHGWAQSASGDRWRLNDAYHEQSQWLDSEPDTWSIQWRSHWIGLGQTPDVYGYYFFHRTYNANGELVNLWEFEVDLCPA